MNDILKRNVLETQRARAKQLDAYASWDRQRSPHRHSPDHGQTVDSSPFCHRTGMCSHRGGHLLWCSPRGQPTEQPEPWLHVDEATGQMAQRVPKVGAVSHLQKTVGGGCSYARAAPVRPGLPLQASHDAQPARGWRFKFLHAPAPCLGPAGELCASLTGKRGASENDNMGL
jgi:hypothetical protein